MNKYITSTIIKKLREEKHMTQAELADKLCVSNKTISKWETGKGYPDISLIEPLADALGISVIELLSGNDIINTNKYFNMNRVKFYVCPICGNIICSTGETVISCCGITLPHLEAEEYVHPINIEIIEDEYYVSIDHEMTKYNYISFIAAVKDNGYELTKLYPESTCETRFKISRTKKIYYYSNRDGLFTVNPRLFLKDK